MADRSKATEHRRERSDALLESFAFGDYELDTALLELRRGGAVVPLEPKPFHLLLHLIRHRDRMVSSEELLRELWPDTRVTRSSLATALYEMRRALGAERRWIATARGRGYRFAGEVEERRRPATHPSQAVQAPISASLAEREVELEELHAALRRARAGERGIALLHGPPGIGKTRTVMELARAATPLGFDVQLGRAYESEGAPPFWPWIQVLRGVLDARGEEELRATLGADTAVLIQLLPDLRRRLEMARPSAPSGGASARFHLFDAIARVLARAAHQQPLLLILEDLHWADEASLALLLYIAQNVHRAPLAIVGTHRELASASALTHAQALGRILAEPGSTSLALVGLTRDTVASILRESLACGVDPILVERVHAVTGGNPFFVTELARLLALRSGEPLDPSHIPLCLQDAVRVRIAECSTECVTLLRGASAIGAQFDLAILWHVLHAEGESALEALDEAERRGLLVRGSGPGEYRFAHAVLRETLHADLGTSERVRLHRDIALALEERGLASGARLSEVAHHFFEATPLAGAERAILYARRAAEHASSVSAHDEAVAHCRRALYALDYLEPPDPELRCTLMVELGEALSAAHAPIEAVDETFSHAIQLARNLVLPRWLARAAVGSTAYIHGKDTLALLRPRRAGRLLERMAPHLEHAAAALQDPADAPLRARTLLALAALRDAAGHADQARPLIASALGCAEAGDDPALRAEALLRQWSTVATLDRSSERSARAYEALELARSARRHDLEIAALHAQAFHALERGDRDELDDAGRAIEALADAHMPDALGAVCTWRCLSAQLDGRLDAAERAIADGAQLATRLNYTIPRTAVTQAVQEWWLGLLRGRAHAIASQWERFVAFDSSLQLTRFFLARLHVELDPYAHQLGDVAGILADLPRDDHWLFCASIGAELCAHGSDRESAAELFKLLHPYAERSISAGWILICTGSVARPLGVLAALLGRWSECTDFFDLALSHADRLRSPLLRTLAEHEYAGALQGHPRLTERRRGRALAASAARGGLAIGVALPERHLAKRAAPRHDT